MKRSIMKEMVNVSWIPKRDDRMRKCSYCKYVKHKKRANVRTLSGTKRVIVVSILVKWTLSFSSFCISVWLSLNELSFASARLRWKPVLSVRGFKTNSFQQLDTVTETTGQTCIYELSLNVKEHQEHYLDIPSNGTPSCCNEYSAA